MRLSVIIVSYNVKYYLEQCLHSLQRALDGIESEVIVVDNHSHDGSVDYLSARFPGLRIMGLNHNLGFAKANNKGIRLSTGRYVLLLNPDTIMGEACLRQAVDFMDSHEKAGGVGMWMLDVHGNSARESRRGIPTPMTSFYKFTGLCARFPHHPVLGKYYMGGLPWNQPGRIEIISGACCLLRRRALEQVGLLDEDFFMYGEDIDLSYRVIQAGWENWYLPLCILHYKGESTQKSSFRYVHVFYEAMLIFFKKHYRHFNALVSIPIQTAIYVKAFLALAMMQIRKARKAMGFVRFHAGSEPTYVFCVSEKRRNACQTIIDFNGLNARFMPFQSWDDMQRRHEERARGQNVIVVFDMESFTYDDILRHFPSVFKATAEMAFFHPESNVIITEHDIFSDKPLSTSH